MSLVGADRYRHTKIMCDASRGYHMNKRLTRSEPVAHAHLLGPVSARPSEFVIAVVWGIAVAGAGAFLNELSP
jgi:hypothetical protein